MSVFAMSDRRILERALRRNIYLNLYTIGDLDDFFWPWTAWYGIGAEYDPDAIALVYRGIEPPTVLALDWGIQGKRIWPPKSTFSRYDSCQPASNRLPLILRLQVFSRFSRFSVRCRSIEKSSAELSFRFPP